MRHWKLALCLLLALLCSCTQTNPTLPAVPAASLPAAEPPAEPEVPSEPDAAPETPPPAVEPPTEPDAASETPPPESEPGAPVSPDVFPAHEEGDVDHDTLAQISALEQNTQVRDDDVAPVESDAYCRLTVTVEALLERKDALPDVMLPPDGVFYSGAIVLSGTETALDTITGTLSACGLACTLDGDEIQQVAGIANDLQADMHWGIRCNDDLLEDPASYALQTGDVLTLAYELR